MERCDQGSLLEYFPQIFLACGSQCTKDPLTGVVVLTLVSAVFVCVANEEIKNRCCRCHPLYRTEVLPTLTDTFPVSHWRRPGAA